MQNVAILYGGKSGEHEVSLVSALSIVRHLDRKKYNPLLIGIAKDGVFYLQDQVVLAQAMLPDTKKLPLQAHEDSRVFAAPSQGLWCKGKRLGIDVVFPVLHGTFGEDGTIQGLLETASLPYVGASVLGSALGMDKEKAKMVWREAGLPVVPYVVVHKHEFADDEVFPALVSRIESNWKYPVFVKPVSTGSSVGASKADSRESLCASLCAALEWDAKAMVEPFVRAREIECSVTGNEKARAYVPCEILPHHEFYDYDAKYLDPQGAEFLIPANLGQAKLERVRDLAVQAYERLDCSGFARVDFFIDKDSGELMINEINTIPGFTSISMFPRMCEAGGLSYPDLISHGIELALDRQKARSAIRYD